MSSGLPPLVDLATIMVPGPAPALRIGGPTCGSARLGTVGRWGHHPLARTPPWVRSPKRSGQNGRVERCWPRLRPGPEVSALASAHVIAAPTWPNGICRRDAGSSRSFRLPTAPAGAQSDRSPAPEPQGAPSDSAASTRDHDGRGTSITTEDEGPDLHRPGTTRRHDEPQRRAVNHAGAAPRARWQASAQPPETAHTGGAGGSRNRVAVGQDSR